MLLLTGRAHAQFIPQKKHCTSQAPAEQVGPDDVHGLLLQQVQTQLVMPALHHKNPALIRVKDSAFWKKQRLLSLC